ncbi:MAG: sulfurtransferase TusA family protein [Candidatus Sulfobium sp.]|jgi:tRNA 2-thiouridine synthesizing protein A
MVELAVDVKIDCKGLICPLPVVKTKKALSQIAAGQVLEVAATDPGSKSDIPALVRNMGSEILETRNEQGAVVFLIRKK